MSVVKIVDDHKRRQRRGTLASKQRAFIRLLEKVPYEEKDIDQLNYLLDYLQQRMSPHKLEQLLKRSTPSETGLMRLQNCKVLPSHFLIEDSEDPAQFLPVQSEPEEDLELEAAIEKNASGHGLPLIRIPRRYEELPMLSESKDHKSKAPKTRSAHRG